MPSGSEEAEEKKHLRLVVKLNQPFYFIKMRVVTFFALLLAGSFLHVSGGVNVISPPETYSACAFIGYIPGELDCATCSLIQKALEKGGAEEAALCRACCSDTIGLRSMKKFETARLEVPKVNNMFGNMMIMQGQEQSPYSAAGNGPKEWIEKSMAGWEDAVEIELVNSKTSDAGTGAVLVLQPEEGSDAAPLRVPVGSWKYEQIDAFLKRKLQTIPKAFQN
jgi:hypothetical protein